MYFSSSITLAFLPGCNSQIDLYILAITSKGLTAKNHFNDQASRKLQSKQTATNSIALIVYPLHFLYLYLFPILL